ncbi:hypothetical protein [Rossellomorea aquimaris]|uniref:hypothetical protein n=1 Tax=Rossellomorea aquimaris TaxID=189382 RepID=UPI0007D096E4|nr:hypothetical protein [Rossellomorea aquimaris]
MNFYDLTRDHIAAEFSHKEFFFHVIECVEKQLLDWDQNSSVLIMGWGSTYQLLLTYEHKVYEIQIPHWILKNKINRDYYSLDRYLWSELIRCGVAIPEKTPYIKGILNSYKYL